MSVTINGTNGLTFNDNTTQATSPFAGGLGFRNRIINGDMRIDQRNAGAAVTVNSSLEFFPVDRFVAQGQPTDGVFTLQRSTVAPAGFTNSLLATVTTADASIGATQFYFLQQKIEGFNVADSGFGTASASTITLSFWVRSSVTGTFGGSLTNSAATRSYPFAYTINSANTFEYKTVTIAGDTTGTWLTDNGVGFRVYFNIGAGSSYTTTAGAWASQWAFNATGGTNLIATNGATFYITGVQLEKGSTATSFDYRPYGTELQLCQRYYYKNTADQAFTIFGSGLAVGATSAAIYAALPASMRAVPSTSFSFLRLYNGTTGIVVTALDASFTSRNVGSVGATVASGLTAGQGCYLQANNNTAAFIDYSAEL